MAWTLVGVGAGFAAGLFVGLSAFDDSIHSDRKVWTSVIVGAAAGGLAGGLISRNVGRGPQANSMGARSLPPDLRPSLWPPLALSTSNGDEALRRRVREVNVSAVAGSPQ